MGLPRFGGLREMESPTKVEEIHYEKGNVGIP